MERIGSELEWFHSDERDALRFDDDPASSSAMCQRCKDLDVLSWLRTKPPIISDTDLDKMSGDSRLFRKIGQVESIVLRDDCGLCRCLFGLIPNPSELDQEVILVLSWSMYRLEASIATDTDEKCASAKYVSAILDPSEVNLNIADLVSTRGDGLSVTLTDLPGLEKALSAKQLDPDRIDAEQVLRWLSMCERLHPITCKPQVAEDLREALKLICLVDAESGRLVPYSTQTSDYLALSYKWGKTKQDFSFAGKPGYKVHSLPQTIEDALKFVKDIGQRYLWVDSLCIDQSDEASKLRQIGLMSAIFQGAYATLIAFSGDSAASGLPRVGHTKTPYRQLSCSIDGVRLVGFGPTLSQLVWVLPWGQRAWTYQEAILSRRCIYLSKYHTYFECNSMTCCETLDESLSYVQQVPHDEEYFKRENRRQKINTGVLRSPLAANMDLEYNALELYSIYATLYSLRKMTKQSDALFAFSGILQALESSTYKKGMFWALPHADMNWALLWCPYRGEPRCESFPKWCWLSWRGRVWPGQPTSGGPQRPHRYPFDLRMWKRSTLGLEIIFDKSYDEMGAQERKWFPDDPFAERHTLQETGCLSYLSSLSYREAEQLLCVESFMLRFSSQNWFHRHDLDDQESIYFEMTVGQVVLYIETPRICGLDDSSRREGERLFLLLARYIRDGDSGSRIAHYFLMLKPEENSFKRIYPVRITIQKRRLQVLKSLNITRTRVLLS